ncbi:MAG: hypothetical protein R3F46_03000 [bacterium]
MAILNYDEMVAAIRSHPDYYPKWQKDTDARSALGINFCESRPGMSVDVAQFELANGGTLIVDLDENGIAVSIEFC